MSIICFMFFVIILYFLFSRRGMSGGGDCPEGYSRSRCMNPDGSTVCTKLTT